MADRAYDAVFFDAGHTLIWTEPSADDIWCRALEDHGYRVGEEDSVRGTGARGPEVSRTDIHRAQEAVIARTLPPFPRNLQEQAAFFRRFDAEVLERLDVPVSEDLLDTVARRFAEDPEHHAYEDVDGTLERLVEEGYRLGVISNATHDLPPVLDRLELAGHFDAITYSWEAGANKPEPAIFLTALRRLGVDASRAVHVGDDYAKDVVGARGAGMTAVLIDREGDVGETECPSIGNLLELTEWLDHPSTGAPSRY
jgi:putative hydrolase of the HAD superfamily